MQRDSPGLCVVSFVLMLSKMAAKVIILGHSFVSRFQCYCDRTGLDNIGLNPDKFSVRMIGLSGLSLRQRRRLRAVESQLHSADLVLVDIGSNDLTCPSYLPEQFALDLLSYVSFLLIGLSVKKVVILQLLRRERTPFSDYNDNICVANSAIQTAVSTSSLPIYFWKHRGMWNCQSSIYSTDGIHLSHEVGYPKYLRSVRDCIIRVARWVYVDQSSCKPK